MDKDEAAKSAKTPEPDAGSATGIFGVAGPAADSAARAEERDVAAHGGFTEIFRAVGNSPVVSPGAEARQTEPPVEAPSQAGPGDFTRIFTRLPTPGSGATPPTPLAVPPPLRTELSRAEPGPEQGRGEFTQFFERLNAPAPPERAGPQDPQTTVLPSSAELAAKPADKAAAEPASEPGAFTQLFRSIQAERGGAERVVEARAPAEEKRPAVAFRNAPPEPARDFTPAPTEGAGGFTRLFGALAQETSAALPQSSTASSEPERSHLDPYPGLGSHPGLEQHAGLEPRSGEGGNAPFPRSGGAVARDAPLQAGPGEFTRLMQALAEPNAPAPPDPSRREPGERAAEPSGPGEFTRVVSESALHDVGDAGRPAAKLGAAPRQAPAPPVTQPYPPTPRPLAFGALGQPPAPPAFPPPAPFAGPPPAAPAGKLQKYTPLLLILNAFLLLLLILAVILLLMRR